MRDGSCEPAEAGQTRSLLELRLELAPFGDVAAVQNDAAVLAVHRSHDLDFATLSGAVAEEQRGGIGPPGSHVFQKRVARFRLGQEVSEKAKGHRRVTAPERPPNGGTGVADGVIDAHDEDHVRRVLDQRAEMLLTLA